MSKSRSITKSAQKPSAASKRPKRPARTVVDVAPTFASSVQLTTPFDPRTIGAVVELMREGDHGLPRDAVASVRFAHYRDWHASFIVRAAAEAGLPERAILLVLIEQARECVEQINDFRHAGSHDAEERIRRSEDLLSGKADLSDLRTFYETRGMIDYAPHRESLWGFTCSLVEAAYDLVHNDEREVLVSHEIARAAQHMVREFFEEQDAVWKRWPTVSSGGVPYPIDAQATALRRTDKFVESLKTKLELAIAARKAA